MIYHQDQSRTPDRRLGGTLYRHVDINGFYAELDPGEDPAALPDGPNGWRPVAHDHTARRDPIYLYSRCTLGDGKPDPFAVWRSERSGWSSIPYDRFAAPPRTARTAGVGYEVWRLLQIRHRDDEDIGLQYSQTPDGGPTWLTVERLDEGRWDVVRELVIR